MALVLGALWNYAGKQPFVSSTFLCLLPCLWLALIAAAGVDPLGHGIPFGALISWSTIPVIVLCALAAAVLASAALALSTRLAPVFTLCFCGVFFSLTLLATPLWPASACGAGWVKVLLPNWQLFWMLDVLADRGACPWSYVQLCGVYALAWILAWACLGLASFRHRDIE